MAKNWIVVGDPTSSGGSVLTGSSFTGIDGLPVARVTDQATCPSHKGAFPIVDGDATILIDGQPVALHGSSLACGCKVLSAKQMRAFVEPGGGGGAVRGNRATIAMAAVAGASALTVAAVNKPGAEDAPEYDEALRFCSESGEPLAGMRYTLHFASGSTCSGITDGDGLTERVCTARPEQLSKAVLSPPEPVASCCNVQAPTQASEAEIPLDGVVTNAVGIGVSVVNVKTKGRDRGLTAGEVDMARQVFGDSIDYSKVKLHDHEYWLTLGFQKSNVSVTPNGQIYFGKDNYKDDYSAEVLAWQHHFIHEMTHVWQYQLGYPVLLTRAFRPKMSYSYMPMDGKKLNDYNMEQQGDILADYFVASCKEKPFATTLYGNLFESTGAPPKVDVRAEIESIVSDFLSDPANGQHLPRTKSSRTKN